MKSPKFSLVRGAEAMRDKIKDILLASIQVKEEIMRNDIPKIIEWIVASY